MRHTTTSSPTSRTAPTLVPTDGTPPAPPRRHRLRGWLIALVIIAVLVEFNPLHPITWWKHFKDEFWQGWEAAGRDKGAAAARDSAQRHQSAQRHTPPPAATPAR